MSSYIIEEESVFVYIRLHIVILIVLANIVREAGIVSIGGLHERRTGA